VDGGWVLKRKSGKTCLAQSETFPYEEERKGGHPQRRAYESRLEPECPIMSRRLKTRTEPHPERMEKLGRVYRGMVVISSPRKGTSRKLRHARFPAKVKSPAKSAASWSSQMGKAHNPHTAANAAGEGNVARDRNKNGAAEDVIGGKRAVDRKLKAGVNI